MCVSPDGKREDKCAEFDCTEDAADLPPDNTCTFEGVKYGCVSDVLLPYANQRIKRGDAAGVRGPRGGHAG